jgi:hypothetical protein
LTEILKPNIPHGQMSSKSNVLLAESQLTNQALLLITALLALFVSTAGLIDVTTAVADAIIQQMIRGALVRACTSALPVNSAKGAGA